MHVKTDLERLLELQQGGKPTRRDRARIANDDQYAGVLVFKPEMVARYIDRRRGQEVG
jgi:hypothetical protein